MDIETVYKAYESLQNVFSSRDHLIVGRNEEEKAIRGFIGANIKEDKSGLLYVCGHPGQGKTAVVNQVLFDYYGDMDSSQGGIDDRVYILKYNAMRYERPVQFAESLNMDLDQLINKGLKSRIKPIKLLKQSHKSP